VAGSGEEGATDSPEQWLHSLEQSGGTVDSGCKVQRERIESGGASGKKKKC